MLNRPRLCCAPVNVYAVMKLHCETPRIEKHIVKKDTPKIDNFMILRLEFAGAVLGDIEPLGRAFPSAEESVATVLVVEGWTMVSA
jgi:hypothetical protein